MPVQIPPGSHRVCFRTKEVSNVHTGPLPSEVDLQVTVDKKSLVRRALKKDNANHYS
jgi:hypothetical protein